MLHVVVGAAPWVPVQEIRFVVNGKVVKTIAGSQISKPADPFGVTGLVRFNGTVPLLVLDMWEHAYYLQYQNVKGEWVKAFWKIVNWEDVRQRLQKVRTLDLGL